MDNVDRNCNTTSAKNIINIDAFKRLNFLYQAAHLVLPHSRNLSRYYLFTMKNISKRLVIRL
jgi:RNase P subunit RPR2